MQDTRKLLVDRILGVALSIRETKPDKQHVMRNYWIWPHEHPEAAAEVEAIASEIVRCNPLALHEGDVKQSIVPIILKEVVADCIDENRLRTEASSAVDWLAGFDGKQELHVQLANLIVNEP